MENSTSYTLISDKLWKDDRVSDKAIRIMLYMTHCKDRGNEINQSDIADFCRCSRATVSRHLSALKRYGYLNIHQELNGCFSYDYIFKEVL